ncbi:MAG TPA: hypothetical protein VIY48_13855 [Candidatus Paceibacterota bacterium]
MADTDEKDSNVVEIEVRSVEERIRDFSDLLKDIDNLSDKKRQLWREIYENAISDRQNAYVMFAKLVKIAQDKSTEHAVHGKTMSTYIERMSKANDQLIKLAELIAKADHSDEPIDPEEMFNRINSDKQR